MDEYLNEYLKIGDIRTALFELVEKDKWLSQRTTKEIIKALGTIPRYKKWETKPKATIPTENNNCVSVAVALLENEPQTERGERNENTFNNRG